MGGDDHTPTKTLASLCSPASPSYLFPEHGPGPGFAPPTLPWPVPKPCPIAPP